MTSHFNESFDREKLASLMDQHMGLVFLVVNRFNPPQEDYEEYLNIGRVGLWKAIKRYDPSKSKFSTFACSLIKFEIMHHIHSFSAQKTSPLNDEHYFNRPVDVWEYFPKLTDIENKIIAMRIEGHSFKEISQELKIPVHSVRYKFKCIAKKVKEAHEQ